MMFNFRKFCNDYNVPHVVEGHKHCRPGWIQVACPFCVGNVGFHLGFNLTQDRFHCWRCRSKKHIDVIMKLGRVSAGEAKRILGDYKGRPVAANKITPMVRRGKAKLPGGCVEMGKQHKRYLKGRGFDPELLERVWKLKGTGPAGQYKFRIIAPIYFEKVMVSYQGRDITDRQPLRYKACAAVDEKIPHKHVLYGHDLVKGDGVVVVEGIADAWRLGPGAVATFGITYTPAQVSLLSLFKRRFILYDTTDPQAVEQGERLAMELSAYQGVTEIINIPDSDPAEMSQGDAEELIKEIGVRKRAYGDIL